MSYMISSRVVAQVRASNCSLAVVVPSGIRGVTRQRFTRLVGKPMLTTVLRSAKLAHRGNPIGRMASRSEEHTSELQSLMRISYAVFCLKKKNHTYLPRDMS